MNSSILDLKCNVVNDDITDKISQMFDYKFEGQVVEKIPIPIFPKDFGIGLIVGSSGSGKSTILKHCFGNVEDVH